MTDSARDPDAPVPSVRPGGRWLRRILFATAGLALLAVVGSLAVGRLERRRWREFCEAQRALSAQLQADPVFPVRVLDVTEEGDGWESYRSAAMRIGTATHDERIAKP